VKLLQLRLEALEEREGVRARPGESGHNLVAVKAADFARARFHDRVAHRYLAVARDHYATVTSDRQDSRAAYLRSLPA